MFPLPVKKLSNDATLPTYGSKEAAGMDLYSPVDAVIPSMTRQLIKLDISIELPPYTFGHVLPRSGLALKHGIHVGAGVIDSDYRGNVGVLLFNFGEQPFEVKKGDRIAQLVVKPYVRVNVVEEDELKESDRGVGGFGSTGK